VWILHKIASLGMAVLAPTGSKRFLLCAYLTNPNNRDLLHFRRITNIVNVSNAAINPIGVCSTPQKREKNYACTQKVTFSIVGESFGKVQGYLLSTLPGLFVYDFDVCPMLPEQLTSRGVDGKPPMMSKSPAVIRVRDVARVPLTLNQVVRVWNYTYGSDCTLSPEQEKEAVKLRAIFAEAIEIARTKLGGTTVDYIPVAKWNELLTEVPPLAMCIDALTHASADALKYFHLDAIALLCRYWTVRTLLRVPGRDLERLRAMLISEPIQACFFELHRVNMTRGYTGSSGDPTASEPLPNLDAVDDLRVAYSRIKDATPKPTEMAAARIYQDILHQDVHGGTVRDSRQRVEGGHMYTFRSSIERAHLWFSPQTCADALAWLVDKRIVHIEPEDASSDDRFDHIFLATVWYQMMTIKRCLSMVAHTASTGVTLELAAAAPPPHVDLPGVAKLDAIIASSAPSSRKRKATPKVVESIQAPVVAELKIAPCSEQNLGLMAVETLPFTSLIGMAGAGKTMTLAMLLKKYKPEQFLIVSFTNAVKAMIINTIMQHGNVSTIHTAIAGLKLSSYRKKHNMEGTLRILVVEEAGMCDVGLFAQLIDVVCKTQPLLCRIMLMGDDAQLKSINYGALLCDWTLAFPEGTVRFTHIHRVDKDSAAIALNCKKIREGDSNLITSEKCRVIETTGSLESDVANVVRIADQLGFTEKDMHFLAYKSGADGAAGINQHAKQHFMAGRVPASELRIKGALHVGDRITSTVNYHTLEVYRGTVMLIQGIYVMSGTLCTKLNKERELAAQTCASGPAKKRAARDVPIASSKGIKPIPIAHTAVYVHPPRPGAGGESKAGAKQSAQTHRMVVDVSFPGAPMRPDLLLDTVMVDVSSLELMRASTVHKYQGAQSPFIGYFLTGDPHYARRSDVYTACTRAVKGLVIVARRGFLRERIVMMHPERRSSMPSHLRSALRAPDDEAFDVRDPMCWPAELHVQSAQDAAKQTTFLESCLGV